MIQKAPSSDNAVVRSWLALWRSACWQCLVACALLACGCNQESGEQASQQLAQRGSANSANGLNISVANTAMDQEFKQDLYYVPRRSPLLLLIDTDGDHEISPEEIDNAPQSLLQADADQNGDITNHEIRSLARAGRDPRVGRVGNDPRSGRMRDGRGRGRRGRGRGGRGPIAGGRPPGDGIPPTGGARQQGMFFRDFASPEGAADDVPMYFVFDLNKNGDLEASEIAAASTLLRRADFNADSFVTDAEVFEYARQVAKVRRAGENEIEIPPGTRIR